MRAVVYAYPPVHSPHVVLAEVAQMRHARFDAVLMEVTPNVPFADMLHLAGLANTLDGIDVWAYLSEGRITVAEQRAAPKWSPSVVRDAIDDFEGMANIGVVIVDGWWIASKEEAAEYVDGIMSGPVTAKVGITMRASTLLRDPEIGQAAAQRCDSLEVLLDPTIRDEKPVVKLLGEYAETERIDWNLWIGHHRIHEVRPWDRFVVASWHSYVRNRLRIDRDMQAWLPE